MDKQRCDWSTSDALNIAYHDEEWGVPLYDDDKLFEFLMLEGMQAGLSWITILKKREAFREAFSNFDAEKIARFSESDVQRLLQNKGIIRNKRKIEAVITNAKIFLGLKKQGSFADFLWQFVDGVPKQNHRKTMQEIPANTEVSDSMAKALKQKGFKFVGTTICYAFMQATGMVNDHVVSCYRHDALKKGCV
ncbi:MAG: DNA-3-methyladenine glycosylase I [Gammaproteobacteria bacterium]|nr:DNA-3-methyladenine glycosylase I [Gammaproteobacteria bacterium]